MRALLDVNILIALLDKNHIHHASAYRWAKNEQHHGWASCPITQNGCVRIMSQPSYSQPVSVIQAAKQLKVATQDASHQFWSCDLDLLNDTCINWAAILGHRQLTDTYLLALAVNNGGRFVTFDSRITTDAIYNASTEHLVTIKL